MHKDSARDQDPSYPSFEFHTGPVLSIPQFANLPLPIRTYYKYTS